MTAIYGLGIALGGFLTWAANPTDPAATRAASSAGAGRVRPGITAPYLPVTPTTVTFPATEPSTPVGETPKTPAAPTGGAASAAATSPRTTSPATNTTPSDDFCAYSLHVYSLGEGYLGGMLTVANTSDAEWTGWIGALGWAPAPPVINGWGGTFEVSATATAVVPTSANAVVAPGESAAIGFQASAPTGAPAVSDFQVSGHSCQSLAS